MHLVLVKRGLGVGGAVWHGVSWYGVLRQIAEVLPTERSTSGFALPSLKGQWIFKMLVLLF